jgi:hypothetical protein
MYVEESTIPSCTLHRLETIWVCDYRYIEISQTGNPRSRLLRARSQHSSVTHQRPACSIPIRCRIALQHLFVFRLVHRSLCTDGPKEPFFDRAKVEQNSVDTPSQDRDEKATNGVKEIMIRGSLDFSMA